MTHDTGRSNAPGICFFIRYLPCSHSLLLKHYPGNIVFKRPGQLTVTVQAFRKILISALLLAVLLCTFDSGLFQCTVRAVSVAALVLLWRRTTPWNTIQAP